MPTLSPSPQISVHVVRVIAVLFVQLNPASIIHVFVQPSNETVLPSSHCSPDVMKLSPQTSTQVEAVVESPPVQFHPFTFPVQSLFHLSISSVSPSSQNSFPTLSPSPQISVHVVNVIAVLFVQLNPASIVQVAEHPSPGSMLLSSHPSSVVIKLSPHTDCHDVGLALSPPVQV